MSVVPRFDRMQEQAIELVFRPPRTNQRWHRLTTSPLILDSRLDDEELPEFVGVQTKYGALDVKSKIDLTTNVTRPS